jgi:hypothetical protein
MRYFRGTPPESKSPRRKVDVAVCTITGGHLDSDADPPIKPSGTPEPTANGTDSQTVLVASKEATEWRTCLGAPRDVSGPLSGAPAGTTPTAQVEKMSPPEYDVTKARYSCLGCETLAFLDWIRAKSASKIVA